MAGETGEAERKRQDEERALDNQVRRERLGVTTAEGTEPTEPEPTPEPKSKTSSASKSKTDTKSKS